MKLLSIIAVAVSVLACSRRNQGATISAPPHEHATATLAASPEVHVWGALRAIVHEGKTGPRVTIGEAIAEPHVYAVGALSGLRGEVTIVDGVPWFSYPGDAGTIRVQERSRDGESATLLAAARVSSWRSVSIPSDIGPDEIDERLEALCLANGADVDKPFPLVIEGRLKDVAWHVIDGRHVGTGGHEAHMQGAAKGTIRDGDGMLIGFFSRHHQGVFTHMGQRTHFHVLTSDRAVMGHADRVGVRAGSTLKLPR